MGSRSVTLNYDAKNLLASLTQNGASVPYTYDALGNIRSKGSQSFTFDLGNRLKASSLGGNYVYDGLGRRVQLQSTDGSTRLYAYSQAGQVLWSTSSGGPRPSSTTAYIYLGGKQIAEANRKSGGKSQISTPSLVLAGSAQNTVDVPATCHRFSRRAGPCDRT